MAAYGAELKQGKSPAQAQTYLSDLFHHVVVQDKSASDALNTFVGGEGDVLLDYEDDAIAAKSHGDPIDYVVPSQTILIQNPIAVVSTSRHQAAAKAFVDYLVSASGQRLWAKLGYRPVDPSVAATSHFAKPSGLFEIGYVGGWTKVDTRFFDPTSGIMARIEQSIGQSTGSG
jgi:sulfate transport system substrate-binding protein